MKHPKYLMSNGTRFILCSTAIILMIINNVERPTCSGWITICLMSIGSMLNIWVIYLHGGKMPVSEDAHVEGHQETLYLKGHHWLGDRFRVSVPFTNYVSYMSIGDLFLYPALITLMIYPIEVIIIYGWRPIIL